MNQSRTKNEFRFEKSESDLNNYSDKSYNRKKTEGSFWDKEFIENDNKSTFSNIKLSDDENELKSSIPQPKRRSITKEQEKPKHETIQKEKIKIMQPNKHLPVQNVNYQQQVKEFNDQNLTKQSTFDIFDEHIDVKDEKDLNVPLEKQVFNAFLNSP